MFLRGDTNNKCYGLLSRLGHFFDFFSRRHESWKLARERERQDSTVVSSSLCPPGRCLIFHWSSVKSFVEISWPMKGRQTSNSPGQPTARRLWTKRRQTFVSRLVWIGHVFSWVLPLVLGLDAWVFFLTLQPSGTKEQRSEVFPRNVGSGIEDQQPREVKRRWK